MTQCPFCGETSFYPQGPHSSWPCPLKAEEHQARLAALNVIPELRRQIAELEIRLPCRECNQSHGSHLGTCSRSAMRSGLGWAI